MEEINIVINKILNIGSCPMCAGSFNGHTCIYCGYENNELKELESKLEDLISKTNIKFIDLLELSRLDKYNISIIKELLGKFDFYNKVDDMFSYMISIDNKDTLKYRYLLYYIGQDKYKDKKSFILNKLIKDIYDGKLEDSELISEVFVNFANNMISPVSKRAKASISSLREGVGGEAFFCNIKFDKDFIDSLIKDKNYNDILNTIFHESVHSYQTSNMLKGFISGMIITETKEEVLRSILGNEYYDENYIVYAEEVEARYYANKYTLEYLSKIGVNVSEEYKNICLNEMERDACLSRSEMRTYKGSSVTVSELFDNVINMHTNPALLFNNKKALGIEYKLESGKIVKKSKEEIMMDYEDYMNGKLKLNGDKNEIERIYNYILNSNERVM